MLPEVRGKQEITNIFKTRLTTKLVKGDNIERRKKGMMTRHWHGAHLKIKHVVLTRMLVIVTSRLKQEDIMI